LFLSHQIYVSLCDQVASFAGVLFAQGIVWGDPVIIYVPMVPEAVIVGKDGS
jgi:propionyl-CoA synthetase